ncbi:MULTISPECIES: ATP-grasp domain-containing protein [Rhizobium]|uniref:ATP-grasp domain-containing protein n=1 Tax=Rhizobium TaxID=379 RepID=UPI001C83A83E|nr:MULTISPECIES: acetyl-CoA carboxylase biotin carboxylase subunit family protein [Rhizobium]MBX4921868.1 ATP-grasp domain-containing protein [Rhizobium bangladeshense]MBY3447072.1 ATP-grasp domain-containing protein [Rhizobium laguerreae]
MAKRALILLEGSRGNGPLYVREAKRLGLHPITLATDPAQYDYLVAEGSQAIRVDTNDLEALISECSRLRATCDIAGITGFANPGESIFVTVGKLCRHFNLPGPDPASIQQCCDKYVQRQLLAQAGVPMPAYRLAANAVEAEGAAAEIGLPVIVKPAVGNGSNGVRLCRTIHEVSDHTNYLLHGTHVWQSAPRILVEEFAQGSYYGANIMGIEVIAVGAAAFGPPPHFVFCEYLFPAPLTEDEHACIVDVSLSCLQALGLSWGPTNIEFRWTRRGPVVIEVNPRLATGESELVQLACGIDLVNEHIKLVIGDECDLRAKHSRTAAARFLVPDRDGVLDRIEGTGLAAAVPGVVDVRLYVAPKTPIVRKGNDRDMIGHVIAASTSPAQTKAILQRAVDLVTWSITPVPTVDE